MISAPVVFEPKMVDITLRYGSNDVVNAVIGSDSSKYIENLIAFDPNILKDTDYDTGSFSECKTAELLTIDYNQWDEEWEVRYTNFVFNKNHIKVIPNTTYYLFSGTINSFGVYFRDKNQQLIGEAITVARNATFTTPANCYYIDFSYQGTTYNHDICIFLYWDGSRIGYEPYKEHRYPMPNVAGHGILKVVNGKVVADGDVMTPDGSGNQTIYSDEEDLSTKTWSTDSGMHYTQLINMATSGGDRVRCTNYAYYAYSAIGSLSNLPAGGFTISSNYIYVNSGESNPSGKVIYKLATPTTLTAPTFTSTFYGDDFGTMWMLDEDGNVIDGLQGNEIFYKANVSGFAESMYIEADGDPEYFAAASQLTDTALNTRGYYKMADILQTIGASGMVGGTLRQQLSQASNIDVRDTNCVSMKNLSWVVVDADKHLFRAELLGSKVETEASAVPNILVSAGYKTVSASTCYTASTDMLIGKGIAGIVGANYLLIVNKSCSTVTEIANAVQYLLLAYEKAST